MFRLFLISLFLLVFSWAGSAEADTQVVNLNNWQFVGQGFAAFDAKNKQTLLVENPGSQGVMLVSPNSFGKNTILRYKIRPLTPESVLVAMLSTSNHGELTKIQFPNNYNGNMKYLLTSTDGYFYAFHNAAHGKAPFVREHAGDLRLSKKPIALAKENVMTTRWHDIEVANMAGHLWLKIDGKLIFETQDNTPLMTGNIILRLRGTSDRIGISLIKDVSIFTE